MKAGLIIGLGGTGVLTLQHIKSQLVGGEQRALPPNVRLLALDTVQDQERADEGQSTLKGITLEPGEYFWIGGDIYDYAVEVRKGSHLHVGSWFQAETYLKTLPRASFTLQRGAGQLRQFGRLAIFRDVAAADMSNIRKLINQAMTEIRDTGYIANLDVYLVSSVAGGTGAGMFVDIAYLVRMLAKEQQNDQRVTLRGFLVLPEAFSAIQTGVDNPMRARAYAAMRENRRFMVDFAWNTGYPMYYHPSGEGGVWRSRMRTKLFDSLYHIDGQRVNNPLTQTLPKFGVDATIADAVVAMLDDPEDKYGQHNQNVISAANRNLAQLNRSSLDVNTTAFDSAVGTYTMLLPMRQIVEALGYRLMLEALDVLTAPAVKDEDGNPTALHFDRNPESGQRGRDAAVDFLTAGEIQSLSSEEKIVTTLLPQQIVLIARRYSPQNQGLIQELASRAPAEWEAVLDPTGDTSDVRAVREQVKKELDSSLLAEVPPKVAGEKPQDALARIPAAVEKFKADHLGREDPRTGQRSGGKYREALDKYAAKHVERFRSALNLQLINVLNGSPQRKPREAKQGRLGFAQDMLDGMDQLLGRFILALDATHQLRERLGSRSSALGNVQSARQEMERKPGGLLGWGGTQKAYLEAEQELVDLIKVALMEATLRSTVLQMQEHVRDLKASLDAWATTLALGHDGLYGWALRGQKKIEDVLQEQGEVKVRAVLPFPERRKQYYDDLYNRYAETVSEGLGGLDGVNAVLKDLTWGLEKGRKGGRDLFGATLSISGSPAESDQDGQLRNLELLLNRSLTIFQQTWQQESVLKYLMKEYRRPEALADMLVDNGGPLLSITGGQTTPSNYFHITFGNNADERNYLDGVKKALVKRLGATGVVHEVINSADRFACRLIYTLDLVPLDQIASYNAARPAYLTYAQRVDNAQVRGVLGRETLHLFPAEVNAAKFEARVPTELQLPARELHNEVVLQLENIADFRIFVRAWVYGVVGRGRNDISAGYLHYYALKLPEENVSERIFGEQRGLDIYLSEPKEATPSLLEALETFQYVRKDWRPEIEEPIPYERMERAVALAKKAAVEKRLSEEMVLEPLIQKYLEKLPETDQKNARRLLVERAILKERQEEVRKDIMNANNPAQIRDVAIVFWLALEDEIKSVQEAITSLLEATRGVH